MAGSASNTFKGKIKKVVDAPPYQIVTIELDPTCLSDVTVAYIPVPGGPRLYDPVNPTDPQVRALTADGSGNQGGGQVTVTIPVPTGVVTVTDPNAGIVTGN